MLRTYRTCNSTMRFSKYEFYNKLLGGISLLRITLSMIWTQPIYIYIYILFKKKSCTQFTKLSLLKGLREIMINSLTFNLLEKLILGLELNLSLLVNKNNKLWWMSIKLVKSFCLNFDGIL